MDSSKAAEICGVASEGEDIRVHTVSVSELLTRVAQAEINNSATLICLQWLQLNRSRLQRMWL